MVGPSISPVHVISISDFHVAVHQQVSGINLFIPPTLDQLDLTLRLVIKAPCITLSHYQKPNPALLQEFPLAFTFLLNWCHFSAHSQEIVLKKTH